jgi:hypothetical protein
MHRKNLICKNEKIFFSIIFMLILFIISNVSAIGITPGRTTLNFEARLHQDIPFSVVNTEHKNMSVVFFISGNLNRSITLKQTYAQFSSKDDAKSFTYSVDLPDKFDKPGMYEAEVVAMEMPENLGDQGAFIGSSVAVATQLDVYVPYPNKYLEGELNVVDSGDGKITFLAPIINRGQLDIGNVKAQIDIYTALNEKVGTIETNEDSLTSLKRTELVSEWQPSVNPGRYLAVATIIYDNEVLKIEKEFNVGEMVLQINDIYVNNFQLGEIAKFNALVENKWSSDLKDVYLNILVYNNAGEIMADFKSPTYDINSLSKSEMVAYWDTVGVHEGTYNGKVILNYGENKSSERNLQLKISQNDIAITGFTGHVLVQGKGGVDTNTILIILVIVLVVANIIWFVVVKRFMKHKK